jgi:hypothetical protein
VKLYSIDPGYFDHTKDPDILTLDQLGEKLGLTLTREQRELFQDMEQGKSLMLLQPAEVSGIVVRCVGKHSD